MSAQTAAARAEIIRETLIAGTLCQFEHRNPTSALTALDALVARAVTAERERDEALKIAAKDWDEIFGQIRDERDAAVARVADLERERDEQREQFERHVETMIEPKLLDSVERLRAERDRLRVDLDTEVLHLRGELAAAVRERDNLRDALREIEQIAENWTGADSMLAKVHRVADAALAGDTG